MGRSERSEISRDAAVERAFGTAVVMSTAELARALRVGEQTVRVAAKEADIKPPKVGAASAWSRDDARRLMDHLSRRPRAGASNPPKSAV